MQCGVRCGLQRDSASTGSSDDDGHVNGEWDDSDENEESKVRVRVSLLVLAAPPLLALVSIHQTVG